jgi:hypothetical protein
MAHPLPSTLSVRNLLEDLLGKEVSVVPVDPLRAKDLPQTVAAVYVDNALKLSAVLGLDLALAAFCGAALGLMPVGAAEVCLEDKALTKVIAENVGELCNVVTGLLNREGSPHLRMYQLYLPGEALPNDVGAHLLALGNRMDLDVTVAKYGTGRLSLALAP